MKDGIIRGEGNSRLLRAPATIPATFAEFRAALINGTLPVDLLYNVAGWDVEGTALNKANLLTDAVAEALGLESDDPTVAEALGVLEPQGKLAVNAIPKGLATGADQALVSTGVGAWAVKTLAQIKSWLGLGSAAYTASTAYATAAQGTLATNAIPKGLATAANQIPVSTAAGAWGVATKSSIRSMDTSSGTYTLTGQGISIPAEGQTYTVTIPHGLPDANRVVIGAQGSSSSPMMFWGYKSANMAIGLRFTGSGTDMAYGTGDRLASGAFGNTAYVQDIWIDNGNIYIRLVSATSNVVTLAGSFFWIAES
jgi:hypothetical protein